jgi:hypothetical protein
MSLISNHLELTIWLADNLVKVVNIYLINVIHLELYSIATRNNTQNQQDVLLIHHTIVLSVCTCIQRYIMYLKRQQLFYNQVSLGMVIRKIIELTQQSQKEIANLI